MAKKKILLLMVALLLGNSIQAQIVLMPPEQLFADTYAVVVGVSNYPQSPLNYTDDDASKFYNHLRSTSAIGGSMVSDENVILLLDSRATKRNIIAALETIVKKAKAKDRIIFYFAGHGNKEGVIPIDHRNQTNILNFWELKSILKKSPSQNKTCIIDACHAGGLDTSWYFGMVSDLIYRNFMNSGIALMLGSTTAQYSLESSSVGQGFFTYYLLKGLKGSADSNRDKKLTLGELHAYILQMVSIATNNDQTPLLAGDYDVNKVLRVFP